MVLPYCLTAVAGFLAGSFPTGFLVGKSQGIDIRQHGSGNIGATNVLRVLGKKFGYLVFAVDALKGVLAVVLGAWMAARHPGLGADWLRILGGVCCILGHNYTPWLGFKGGKGVATSAGVLMALLPPTVLGVVLAVWLLFFFVFRFVSLASLAAAVALPAAAWWLVVRPDAARMPFLWFSLLISALLIVRHKSNIGRLLNGTEPRFERKKK